MEEGLYSVRIVVADFYMHRPVPGLDPNYSEFRGQEIKTLPVIRIFGSDSNGEKVCMHVHGVLPYFYIPYESNNACNSDQIIYQIAASLDKAINVSVGHSHSQSQHVFKIQLVKGIPFYGYHGKEHQFLKIYLYNPRFIKKAANLLQNGAILGRAFQPHESHVPYILQFFIDYNLYGMSFLHAPVEVVKYRQSDEFDVPDIFTEEQILERKIIRISTSRHEVDIAAAFILNRFEHLNKESGNTNPGIESIWQDERLRRQKISEEQTVPLGIPDSQARLLAKPTESEIFYKSALLAKLSVGDDGVDLFNSSVASASITNDRKNKFNLSKLLINSVYPSECSQDLNATLANASKIPDHLSNSSLFHAAKLSGSKNRNSMSSETSFVDEELVLSLSQLHQKSTMDQTLEGEDFQLLDVLEQLEEDEGGIDLDSTLAPLSQIPSIDLKKAGENTNLNMSIDKGHDMFSDDDEDDMHDYTISMDSIDKSILMELSQPQKEHIMEMEKIPQLDGGDDTLSTPKKRRTTRTSSKLQIGSPRTPRRLSAAKYAPLDITINKSPAVKKSVCVNGTVSDKSISNGQSNKTETPVNVRLKRCLVNLSNEFNALNSFNESSRGNKSLPVCDQKSFIVCNLKPRTSIRRTLIMEEACSSGKNCERTKLNPVKKCKVKIKRLQLGGETDNQERKKLDGCRSKLISSSSTKDKLSPVEEHQFEGKIVIDSEEKSIEHKPTEDMNDNVILKNGGECVLHQVDEVVVASSTCLYSNDNDILKDSPERLPHLDKPKIRAVEVKYETPIRRRSWSPSDIAREYDRRNNYYPKPGPSGIKKQRKRQRPNVETTPINSRTTRRSARQQEMTPQHNDVDKSPADSRALNSFYDSPSLFSDVLSGESKSVEDNGIPSIVPMSSSQLAVITPANLPPTFDEVNNVSVAYDIPEKVFTEPFYGDDGDVTSKREVGHTVLHIPGKSLNACEEFKSLLPGVGGISAWRKNQLKLILDNAITKDLQNPANLKEYFSSRERVTISTKSRPPTKNDAIKWLKTLVETHRPNTIEDSPIKVRTEKVKLILDESVNQGGGDDDTCDLSQKSISLSPLTPPEKLVTDVIASRAKSQYVTPLEKYGSRKTPLSAVEKLRERRKSRARLSLARKLLRVSSLDSASSGTDVECPKLKCRKITTKNNLSVNSIVNDLDRNETLSERSFSSQEFNDLCSEKVKEVLERTSFIKKISNMDYCDKSDISFGLSGATLDNTFGFKISLQNLQKVKADVEYNNLTVFSLEIHVKTRGDLNPDPQFDPVDCLFFSICNNCPERENVDDKTDGFIIVDQETNSSLNGVKATIVVVKSEMELFSKLLELFHVWDPDVLVGYEVEMNSWGYLIDRAHVLGMNLKALLSRIPSQKVRETEADEEKDTMTELDFEMKLCGRIVLDVWRLMRSEIALTSYTFENIAYHILHRRYPKHTFRNLTTWYESSVTRWIVLEHYLERVNVTLEILDQLDLLGRTSEMAKLIGIQFYEVLSRGSQFRVESMMLRIAKPKNFIPVSPSVQQRAHSRAPEYLPLILEPKSRFYADPIIVLDFQSLYPSMIIAYNYCYSTCLGRVEHLGQSTPFEFGASQLRVSVSELKRLVDADQINIAPCGVVYAKKEIREGVLPRMLKEILDTRLMVKQSMKLHKGNATLQRVLHSRQLGLKLMANVTYGYTAANFSGRMACVDVADSILGKARETLERAIKLVEANEEWRVKVVYGDTDSMFVMVPGRDREEAFRIGQEIADAVTNDNPKPVKLKLEKVYQPCILQTKKRYVGYMYETADQADPIYEAKGIETVRRDGCPAVAKMLEKCLRILFETSDVSQIKRYVCRQFTKLLTGQANVQDLIFAKEFRGKNGYKPGACVPALELTKQWLQVDSRREPRRGERVPYLIVNGPPGVPLIRLVRSPHEYLADEGLKINSIYYITKAIIPPLNRCLLLIGADVHEWFADLPRKHLALPAISTLGSTKKNIYQDSKKSTISQYFASSNCIIDCGRHTKTSICNSCRQDVQKCTVVLTQKISKLERAYYLTDQICQSCCGRQTNIECCSLDCPVLYVANLKNRERKQIQHFGDIMKKHF